MERTIHHILLLLSYCDVSTNANIDQQGDKTITVVRLIRCLNALRNNLIQPRVEGMKYIISHLSTFTILPTKRIKKCNCT